jgi:hypothetical protein
MVRCMEATPLPATGHQARKEVSMTSTIEVGQTVMIDMSRMIGFESHIADGNNGHVKAFVKVTFLEDDRSAGVHGGYGTFFTENLLNGIDTFFSYDSLVDPS